MVLKISIKFQKRHGPLLWSCWGCDDDFVDTLLELKVFKLEKGTANETVL